jgi:PAS domain-containing protein
MEELTRLGVVDIHPKEALNHVAADFETQARGEMILSPDIPCRRKDGSIIYASIATAPVVIDGHKCNVGFFTDITERKLAEEAREKLIHEIQDALAQIKKLSGLLPICASCKKIRDDKGYWNQIESYIRDHSEAEFSHGICPDCMKKLYPNFADNKNNV